jgi:hypothetical protein
VIDVPRYPIVIGIVCIDYAFLRHPRSTASIGCSRELADKPHHPQRTLPPCLKRSRTGSHQTVQSCAPASADLPPRLLERGSGPSPSHHRAPPMLSRLGLTLGVVPPQRKEGTAACWTRASVGCLPTRPAGLGRDPMRIHRGLLPHRRGCRRSWSHLEFHYAFTHSNNDINTTMAPHMIPVICQ